MINITDGVYKDAKRVQENFVIKNLGVYYDLYEESDTLLLADVFLNFETSSSRYINLILLNFSQHQDYNSKHALKDSSRTKIIDSIDVLVIVQAVH